MKQSNRLAGRAMLVWLAVYLVGTICMPTAAGIFSMLGCIAGTLFAGRDIPLFGIPPKPSRYSETEYVCALGGMISGCALLSFAVSLVLRLCGVSGAETAASGGSFWSALIFSCLLPAFFEELLLRGRVLGLLRDARGGGVWLCAMLFALMHGDFARLPYAFFAGIILSAAVFLTENLYLGMLFHFCNNLASLLLSRLPDAAAYGAAALLALLFCVCAAMLRKGRLLADAKALLAVNLGDAAKAGSPSVWLYAAAMLALCVLNLF